MKQVHVLHTFANNDGVPYITWFMKRAAQEHNVRYSFLLLCAQKPKMLEEIRSYGFQGKWIYFDPARRKRGMMAALPRMWWQMMLAQHGAPQVDLLKIDVETYEAEVLRGFLEILRRDRPSMLIEILNDKVAAEVSGMLDGLGYAYYNIDDVSWPPKKTDVLSKSDHFNFLVCRPEVAKSIGL